MEPSDEGGYTFSVSLPDCICAGDTREEALENVRAASDLFLEEDETQGAIKNEA